MDMDLESQLNFVEDPKKYNTKFLPKEESPVMVFCGKGMDSRTHGGVRDISVRYNFSSFEFPDLMSLFAKVITSKGDSGPTEIDYDQLNPEEFSEDSFNILEMSKNSSHTLIIAVDNSFNIYDPNKETTEEIELQSKYDLNYKLLPQNLNFCFIDHHLYEQKVGKCPYASNSILIYRHYKVIKAILEKILQEKQIDSIGVLFHTDLDGIGSGILIAKIIEDIKSEGELTDIEEAGLAMVLGEYGDISEYKVEDLNSILHPRVNYQTGIKRKFDLMSKNLGRFMKAIRPVIDDKVHCRSASHRLELIDKFDEFKFKYGLGYKDFLNSYLKLKVLFNNIQEEDVNSLTISKLISKIVQDPINAAIIELVQNEIDFFVDAYLRPDTPQLDMVVHFENDGTMRWPNYRMLFIDSPLDIGRSIIWTYKGRLQYFKDPVDKKKFTMANYKQAIPDMIMSCHNICCYNLFSGKLSLHSFGGDSAYEIGKFFGGGGHGGVDGGSLGSVLIDFKTLRKHTKVVEIV